MDKMTAEKKTCKKHIDMPLEHCHYCLVECREIGEKNQKAKVLEILNSGHINEDMFGWLCKLAEQDMLPAPSAIVEKTKEFAKKRISEAI